MPKRTPPLFTPGAAAPPPRPVDIQAVKILNMAPSAAQRFAEISTPEPPGPGRVLMHRAVVLGGSVAGLMAARVLSDHADEVLIVERDPTEGDGPRPGVPQGTQVHALLPTGQTQLERW